MMKRYQKFFFIILGIIILLAACELFSYSLMAVLSRFGIFDDTFTAAKLKRKFLWERGSSNIYEYHPYLLYKVAPGAYFVGCTADKHGFFHNGNADSFNPYKKNKQTYRIFFIGGSTAASYYAHSNSLTISAFLERFLNGDERLKQALGVKNFEVINAARSGYFSTQELIFAAIDLIYYQPDMLITFDGYNEWRYSILKEWEPHSNRYAKKLTQGFNQAQTISGSLIIFTSAIKSKISYLFNRWFNYTKHMFAAIIYKLQKFLAERGENRLREYEVDKVTPINEESIDIYRQNLINFIGICQVRNIAYIAALQPTLNFHKENLGDKEKKVLQEYGYALKHKSEYFTQLESLFKDLKQRYASQKIKVADLTEIFSNVSDDVYVDFCHYNKEGNELIAKKIYEIIKEQ
jgi:hypothetical protein